MKNTISNVTILSIILVLFILVFGCLGSGGISNVPTQAPKQILANEIENTQRNANLGISNNSIGTILVEGNEQLSNVRVFATSNGGEARFALEDRSLPINRTPGEAEVSYRYPGSNGTEPWDYTAPFGQAGIYSKSFIVLNSSHVKMLGSNETIWLTPAIRQNGSEVVLFNAIYRTYIPNLETKNISILGRAYSVEYITSRQGQAFESDEKWKVAIMENKAKPWSSNSKDYYPQQVLIYLDGYFSDMKENQPVPLFRNDGSVRFEFGRLWGGTPYFEVIGTKPTNFSQGVGQ